MDRDSSQDMKNPVAMQSTKPKEKSSIMGAVCRRSKQPMQFRKGCKISQPLQKLLALRKFYAIVHLSYRFCLFDFFFLSLFDYLPDLPPL